MRRRRMSKHKPPRPARAKDDGSGTEVTENASIYTLKPELTEVSDTKMRDVSPLAVKSNVRKDRSEVAPVNGASPESLEARAEPETEPSRMS